jgi:hypothetical protein
MPYSRWLRSRLFRSYLLQFPLIWVLAKAANGFTAAQSHLPPLGFRPLTEIACCIIELFILWVFIRRNNEDLLLGNLGLSWVEALLPLVPLHFALSSLTALA